MRNIGAAFFVAISCWRAAGHLLPMKPRVTATAGGGSVRLSRAMMLDLACDDVSIIFIHDFQWLRIRAAGQSRICGKCLPGACGGDWRGCGLRFDDRSGVRELISTSASRAANGEGEAMTE
jgi:hypothetical protein